MDSIIGDNDEESIKEINHDEFAHSKSDINNQAKNDSKAKLTFREKLESPEGIQMIYLVFGLISIFVLMSILQFRTDAICCGDQDGYYHIRWSSLLWANFSQFKWLPEFTWLPLTVLDEQHYADHHFLFHLLQIPFLWFFNAVTAAKVAAVFYGSLAIFSVYWLMWRYKIRYLLLWLLALLTCANPFFYRMNMAKAPPLTIIYTVIGIYLLFERKYKWLLPLAFIFVWTYSLFPLLFVIAVIWVAVVAIDERKIEWKVLAYTAAGMILGNIINPYFPKNIMLFVEHFATKFGALEVAVGGEWYPYNGTQLLTHLSISLIAMICGYILFRPISNYLPKKATFMLVFSTVLLIWMFRSKRLAEYFPPFAIAFFAFSWQAFFRKPVVQLPDDFLRDIDPYLDVEKKPERSDFWTVAEKATPFVLGTLLIIVFYWNFVGVHIPKLGIEQEGLMSAIKDNEPNDKYKAAIVWARDNIPAGELIFNCNWDDFPKLFFHDQKHSYVYGLDPMYLYSKNPELFGLLKDITSGKVEDPAPIIRDKFGSNYIFTDAKENVTFIAQILESGWVDTVYQDKDAIILRIRDQQGDPPSDLQDDKPKTSDEQKQLNAEEKKDKDAVQDPDPDDDPAIEEEINSLEEESDPSAKEQQPGKERAASIKGNANRKK